MDLPLQKPVSRRTCFAFLLSYGKYGLLKVNGISLLLMDILLLKKVMIQVQITQIENLR